MSGRLSWRRRRKEGCSFLKKKNQKTLHMGLRRMVGTGAINQKFLASFFQKSSASLRVAVT
jgi:hypothetical protein